MRIEMGRARNIDATQDNTIQKQKAGTEEIKSKNAGKAGVVQQQRELIESKQCDQGAEIVLHEKDEPGFDWERLATVTEKNERESQVCPGSEQPSLNDDDYKTKGNNTGRSNSRSEEDTITSKCQGINRRELRSRNTYVKLWAHKESHRKDQSPNRIKVKIGSLSCGDTVRFLEAEKVRVLGEIRAEHEKRLGSVRDIKLLTEKIDKPSKEVEDTKEMDCHVVHDGAATKALKTDEQKSGKPMELEEKREGELEQEHHRVEDGAAEINDIQWTEPDETFSQELRFRPVSYGKIIQQADKELRIAHENTVQKTKQKADREQRVTDENILQPAGKAKRGTGPEDEPAGVVTGQIQTPKEQVDSKRQKRASTRPIFVTGKKMERRITENFTENKGQTTTLLFHPPSSADSKSYRACQGERPTRFDKCPIGNAEAANRRAAQQGEEEEEEQELQRRALFHLEALRRIEESYNQRRNREKYNNFKPSHPNETSLQCRGCWDNYYYGKVHETQKHQLGNLQNKGKCGLNALLAPVFEEEIQRQYEDLDQISPANSSAENQVFIFQRMKKARLRAAEEQVAAARARAKQRIARLKATIPKMEEKARAPEQCADRKDKKIGGESFKYQTDRLSAKQAQERLLTPKPSSNYKPPEHPVKRIKELNEKTRAEEELEGARRKRAKIQNEETKARLRNRAADAASVELYSQLSKDDRSERSGLRLDNKSRFNSQGGRSQKLRGYNGLQGLQFSPLEMTTRFRSPLTSPRKAMKNNSSEHFANWEQELRTAQRSQHRRTERSAERRISIQEDLIQNSGRRENPQLKTSSSEKILKTTNRLCHQEKMNKSPPAHQSPLNTLRNEAIPDHYNSVEEGCKCDVKYKEKNEKTGVKVVDEKTKQTAKGVRWRENCRSLNWLGKLYYTITSFN